ncbi:carbon-nitrogen hydrolase family protein [Arthrobacter sp. CJ23]|uniref:carbon-nitrogen hydrolase family protein n=1 Tax=Arthrobacter sp. CJ23 TaxID=2972479 RepID=UPI00215C1B81|nr:carbon-nitrogen hydrolase family protein [Arthrobacter sp. CJ23]UVJ40930.1 carbon-nitrogen hydrolase family protein [Arthrobacter sp. CJ23]
MTAEPPHASSTISGPGADLPATPGVSPTLTVSAVQYEAVAGDIPANAAAHMRLIEDAHSHGARLVVFPELSLLGYELGPLRADPAGEAGGQSPWLRQEDPSLAGLREICRRTGITTVAGAAWRDPDGTPRLASLIVAPGGEVRAVHKTHLHGPERELFVPGTGPGYLAVDGWKVALAVCADAAHPSHAAMAADAGADVYAVSALYAEGEETRLGLHLGARAMDNRMFSILANLGGTTPLGESCGLSGAWGPDGRQLAQASGTRTAMATATLQQSSLVPFRTTLTAIAPPSFS